VSAREAALWDRAGEEIMAIAAQELAAAGKTVSLYKNNTDGAGASYGMHENYLVPRRIPFGRLVEVLIPFLTTRQIYSGSGRVGLGQRSSGSGYQLSQRADFIEAEVGLETTFNRPIVNSRDEPHADPTCWRRLHVIVGDATMMEVATYLRVGVTGLLLKALAVADRHDVAHLVERTALLRPVDAFSQVSRDLTVSQKLDLADTGRTTAIEIQRRYLEFVVRWTNPWRAGGADRQSADLMDRWLTVLDQLEHQPSSAARQVEWLAKLQLLESIKQRRSIDWDSPILRAADLRWTDVDPAVSLFRRVEAAGLVESLFSADQVRSAVQHPPASTRAYLRGELIGRFPANIQAANWDSLTVRWRAGTVRVNLAEPLAGRQELVGAALAEATDIEELLKAIG
jgi:proteasome accessory factor A